MELDTISCMSSSSFVKFVHGECSAGSLRNKKCSEWVCPCSTSIGTLRKERTSWHELLWETNLGCTTFNQNQKELPWNGNIPPRQQKKKFKTIPSARKVIFTVFWNMQGVILQKIQPHSENVNAASYCSTLWEL